MIFADEIRSRLKWGLERYFNQMPSEVAEEITQFHAAIGSAPAYCIEETALQFLFSVVPNTMALQVKASEVNLPFDRVFVETRSAFTVPGHWKTGTLICKQSDRIELFEFFDFDIGDLSGEVGLDRRLLGMVEEAKRGQTDKMRFAFSIPMNRKVMLLDGDIGQEGVQPTQAGIWARQTFKMDTVADVFRQNSDMSRLVWMPLFLLIEHREFETIRVTEADYEKLNRKREKQGKDRLVQRRTIQLGQLGVRHMESPDADSARTSPRAHFVRGHFFRHQDRLIWRRPHVRGAGDPERPVTQVKV